MIAAHIIGDLVVNVIEVKSIESFKPEDGYLVEAGEEAGIGTTYSNGKFYLPCPTNTDQSENRRKAYQLTADPLFFLIQRGEATQEEWTDKIAEIKERFPYYFDEQGNLIEAQ